MNKMRVIEAEFLIYREKVLKFDPIIIKFGDSLLRISLRIIFGLSSYKNTTEIVSLTASHFFIPFLSV